MQVVIDITQELINEGKWRNCEDCPVARGIQAVLREPYTATIQPPCAMIREPNDNGIWGRPLQIITLPSKVRTFIRAYDNYRSTEPFSFPLDIKDEYLATSPPIPSQSPV